MFRFDPKIYFFLPLIPYCFLLIFILFCGERMTTRYDFKQTQSAPIIQARSEWSKNKREKK